MRVEPVTLEGSSVRLEPLTEEHVPALCRIGFDPDLWQWTLSHVGNEEEMRRYVRHALRAQKAGEALPFVTIRRVDGAVAGSTRFGSIDTHHRRAEIGWTWLGREFQRSALNTEAKFLMLRHAFESWECIRVELKTDVLNTRSQAAIRRIGATQEGVFRRHLITKTGRVRDSMWFSIIDSEWPAVKERLLGMMGRGE